MTLNLGENDKHIRQRIARPAYQALTGSLTGRLTDPPHKVTGTGVIQQIVLEPIPLSKVPQVALEWFAPSRNIGSSGLG